VCLTQHHYGYNGNQEWRTCANDDGFAAVGSVRDDAEHYGAAGGGEQHGEQHDGDARGGRPAVGQVHHVVEPVFQEPATRSP